MIVSYHRANSFTGEKSDVRRRIADQPLSGIDVIVMVDGVYNGPGNRSLGLCKSGQRITVAAGPYADSLVASDLVTMADDNSDIVEPDGQGKEGTTVQADIFPVSGLSGEEIVNSTGNTNGQPHAADETDGDYFAEPDPQSVGASEADAWVTEQVSGDSWAIFMQANISDRQAKAIHEFGYESPQDLVDAFEEEGYPALTDISGIGLTTARKVFLWAGVQPSELH